MIGHLTKDTFDPEKNYDEFYGGHKFEPFPEDYCTKADEVVPRVAWALDVAQEVKAKTVLDLCCLDGFASLTIASKLGVKVSGIDLSEPGTLLANKRAEAHGLDAVYLNGAIEDVETSPVDLVLLFEAIEHFKDVDKVMDAIKRQMKPGATLLVSTPDAEGDYGHGNADACHLRIYSHRPTDDLPTDTTHTKTKPTVSLPGYLESQGFTVVSNDVWNGLIHTRVTLIEK